MVFPPDDNWFLKFIEQQRQFEKLFSPISETIKQHQKLFDSVNLSSFKLQNSVLQQARIRDYLSLAGIPNNYLSIQQDIKNSLGSIDAISKELEFLKNSSSFSSILAAQENLYRIQDKFAQTRYWSELPSNRIESVLAAAEATSRILKPQSFFADFTLSSIFEYQSFIDRQFKCLQFDNGIIAERRIEVSELSGGLFEIINASLEIGVTLNGQEKYQDKEVEQGETFQCGLYGQVNQHLGFVYSDSYNGEIETSFNRSTPARMSCLGYAIIEQIYKINSICENNGQTPVFKPTTKTMRACGIIPSLIARNETEFNLLIDYLFFLLYEGSGSANRLMSITNESSLEPLWKVKYLRLSARHDIDHGSIREIEKKRNKIKDTYVSLIGRPLPVIQKDWQRAQLRIYVEIELMLQNIIQKITNAV